jgi:hypothetical protein
MGLLNRMQLVQLKYGYCRASPALRQLIATAGPECKGYVSAAALMRGAAMLRCSAGQAKHKEGRQKGSQQQDQGQQSSQQS